MLSSRWPEPELAGVRRLLASPRRPVLVRIGGFSVYSYPTALYTGMVAGVYVGAALVPHRDATRFALAMLLLLVPALAGARLLFVAAHWPIYRRDLRRIVRRSEGGMAMYGGLLLALPLSPPLLHALGLGFGEFWDAATATMIVGAAFTRVGCFVNGCCTGPHVPTPLLESGACVLLLASFLALWPSFPFDGAAFLYGLGGYGAVRFFLELTRDRGSRVTFAQVASASAVLVCLPLYVVFWLGIE